MASGISCYFRTIGLQIVAIGLSISLMSCADGFTWQPDIVEFVIKKGNHSSRSKAQTLMTNRLRFEALFDESAIYTSIDPIQQHSKNKLMGFSDCNSVHQQNSARFGWHWIDEGLHVTAYVYANGQRLEEYIGEVQLNQFHRYEVGFEDDYYFFRLDDLPEVRVERKASCRMGLFYVLWPYFGGQETAPHDIRILIRMLYHG
jgi:hypothetical protein